MAAYPGGEEISVTATGTLGEVRSPGNGVSCYATGQLVSSAFTATIQCQASADNGTTWVALQLTNLNDGSTSTGITANGYYRADVAGVKRFRWQCSAFTSATAAKFYPDQARG